MRSFTKFLFLLLTISSLLGVSVAITAHIRSEYRRQKRLADERHHIQNFFNSYKGLATAEIVVEWQKIKGDGTPQETSLLLRYTPNPAIQTPPVMPLQRIVIPGNALSLQACTIKFTKSPLPQLDFLTGRSLILLAHVQPPQETPPPKTFQTFLEPFYEVPVLFRLKPDEITILESYLWRRIANAYQHPDDNDGIQFTWHTAILTNIQPERVYTINLGTYEGLGLPSPAELARQTRFPLHSLAEILQQCPPDTTPPRTWYFPPPPPSRSR